MAVQIHLRLRAADDDMERLERSTGQLRGELLELDVQDVTPVSAGQAPPGTRAVDVAQVGSLLVTIAQAPQTLRQVVQTIRGWLTRDPGAHSVEITLGGDRLVVSGAGAQTEQRLVEAWLKAHGLETAQQPGPQQAGSGQAG
ncbi:hypothetical protein ACIGXM_21405 [Kitasatospora sp. NPDC052896]|uniref:hypothetical protein n=1 Tax=Kitasatospora sp. NPDC052896 TaxID=3364061 RepID=UPI0037CAE472